MKKLSLMLTLCVLICAMPFTSMAEKTAYSQSPILDALVETGVLPPVEERLPDEPKLLHEILDEYVDLEIGNYGGTLHGITTDPNDYPKFFTGMNESLLSMSSANSDEIIGNILAGYEVNDDCTEYTLYLRKGLKWSDGVPVTMDDFVFTLDHFVLNEELTPVISNKLRAGGSSVGAPFTYEVIDEWSLKFCFESSYGGFPVYLSISGWAGYTDLLKPAHYLKRFHVDFAEECHGSIDAYYEFITPFAEKLGYYDVRENGVWTYVFNDIDMTNWEMDNPVVAQTSKTYEGLIDSDFPVLYGWIIESNINNVATWVRNPYYFKVDADGQQLPYVDYLELSYAEDNNTKLLMQLAGGEDYVQEEADKYSILVESSEQGGYEVCVGTHHNIPTVAIVNINYGLNGDGTVKEDEDSRAWQEVVNDIRFRQALMLAIDAKEITDVYTGMAEPNPLYNCINDVEAANELLDEMGMMDIDGDGYRETPSGLSLTWQIWTNTSNSVTLTVPFCELLVEYWGEIGLRVTVNSTEASLMSTSINSNEVPMYVYLVHMDALWHHQDWQLNGIAPLWNAWVAAGGMYGEDTEGYLEPEQWYKDLRLEVDSLMKVDPVTAVNEVIPSIAKNIADNGYLIAPVNDCGRLMIVNKDLGNVPHGGLAYSWNMAYEQVFYRSFSYEE